MRVVGQKFWMWMSLWIFAPFANGGLGAGQPQEKKTPASAATVNPERHTTSGQDTPKKDDTKNKTKVTPSRKTEASKTAPVFPKRDASKVTPNTPKKDGGKISPNTPKKDGGKVSPNTPKKDGGKITPNTPKKDGGKKPNPTPE
jgi:hypothetical protein